MTLRSDVWWPLGGMVFAAFLHLGIYSLLTEVVPTQIACFLTLTCIVVLSIAANKYRKTDANVFEITVATLLFPVRVVTELFGTSSKYAYMVSGSEKDEMLLHGGMFILVLYLSLLSGKPWTHAFLFAVLCYALQVEAVCLADLLPDWKKHVPILIQEKLERKEVPVEEAEPSRSEQPDWDVEGERAPEMPQEKARRTLQALKSRANTS